MLLELEPGGGGQGRGGALLQFPGLAGMRERPAAHGGALTVEGAPAGNDGGRCPPARRRGRRGER